MAVSGSIPLVDRAASHSKRTAIIASDGTFSYRQLLEASARVAAHLVGGARDLKEVRVGYMVPSSFAYAATQWGIWRAGGIAVPLCERYPEPELAYVIDDAQVSTVVAHPQFEPLLGPIAHQRHLRLVSTTALLEAPPHGLRNRPAEAIGPTRRAMILYTSGTTGRPKGVVSTHANITAQITSLIEAWGWQVDDNVLLVLPLHHIHGIINVLCCALWVGATCQMMPKFEPSAVWGRLIAAWETAAPQPQQAMSEGCRRMRLMVCGSAALPVDMLERWRSISGHTLLERYGMTEIGMALSNPLHAQRRPGHVGSPLPGVEVRLVGEDGRPVGGVPAPHRTAGSPGPPGEIQVRGPTVFGEYWKRPDATGRAFDGTWFKTGDIAVRVGSIYRILGRSSQDIIKTGAEKVCAPEIEQVLRTHEAIEEVAVVGVADPQWGQRLCAAVVLRSDHTLDYSGLRQWAKHHLADYKVPRELRIVEELPRNAMGKVTKSRIVKFFEAGPTKTDRQ